MNPHRQNAKIRIVGQSPNRYTNDFLKNKDVTLPLSTIEVKQKGEHVISTNYSKESSKLSSERRSRKSTFSRRFWHLQTKRSTPLIFDDRFGTPAESDIKFRHLTRDGLNSSTGFPIPCAYSIIWGDFPFGGVSRNGRKSADMLEDEGTLLLPTVALHADLHEDNETLSLPTIGITD